MKRSVVLFSLLLLGITIVGVIPKVQAQFGNSPEAVAAERSSLPWKKRFRTVKDHRGTSHARRSRPHSR